MKKFVFLLGALALFFGLTGPARPETAPAPYTITFDEYPESHYGAQIGEQYAALGIHFTINPPTTPAITFYRTTVFTAATWPNTPFTFLPVPPGQFLAFDKPQGETVLIGIGMTFDYFCTGIGFRYRRPGNNPVSSTDFYVQLFDTTRSGSPFYSTRLTAIVKPPAGSDAGGYLSFTLTSPAPFNMAVLSADKKFQIDDLSITPLQSGTGGGGSGPGPPGQAGNRVQAGGNLRLQASGADQTFTWSARKPDGSPMPFWDADNPSDAGGIGRESGLFVAPSEGNFAGVYQAAAQSEQTAQSQTFSVTVPVKVVADDKLIFAAGDPAGAFTASGAQAFNAWEFVPVSDPAPGEVATGDEGGRTNNAGSFTPAATVTERAAFWLKVTSVNDAKGEYAGYSPKVHVLPVGTLSGRLSDPDLPALDWTAVQARVKLLRAGGEPGVDVAADGFFSFDLPDISGLSGLGYAVRITADGYLTRVVTGLSAGEETYGLVMEPREGSISGNLRSGGADLQDAMVAAYKTVLDNGEPIRVFSHSTLTDAGGDFTLNLGADPVERTADGDYTVIAIKDGYAREVATGIVVQASLGLTDVNALHYPALNFSLAQKTRLLVSGREWDADEDPYTPMVTDLAFTAQQRAFTDAGELTGPTLADLVVGGTHTTNLGSLGGKFLDGATIRCRYTPHTADERIGIQAQAYAGQAYESDVASYAFRVHPDEGAEPRSTQIGPLDFEAGGSAGDASITAWVEVPFGGLSDTDAAAVFIERTAPADATVQSSDVVEIAILDSDGDDLGDVINPAKPLEITLQFDPTAFDPLNFTVYYRSARSDGSWGPWIDGLEDGTIALLSMDLLNGTITLTCTHLSAFGLGLPAVAGSAAGGSTPAGTSVGGVAVGAEALLEGGGIEGVGCFIRTLDPGPQTGGRPAGGGLAGILLLSLLAGGRAVLLRRRRAGSRKVPGSPSLAPSASPGIPLPHPP